MPPQLEKNHVVPTAWQDEALARDRVSREVPCSALKGETAHGQSHRTSVCPDRRGESGRHLLLGSLRALPALGGCCGRGVLPAPSLGVPTRLQRCVFDRPSAKQLPQGRRAWGGLGGRDRSTGKGGAAPAASLASAVRAPSFPLLNAPDFPGSLHVVLCVPLSVGLREWRSGRIP